jgi:hypothetical protein
MGYPDKQTLREAGQQSGRVQQIAAAHANRQYFGRKTGRLKRV